MFVSEYIIYIKILKNNKIIIGKLRTSSLKDISANGSEKDSWKLIYFENKKGIRAAEMRERKLKSLNRKKLFEEIRKSNPELLDLKYTITNASLSEQSIY
jgi:predicted GIY-YIG superfamily endonuclease